MKSPIMLLLLLLALIAFLVFLVIVIMDRFEEFGYHPQPTHYAALSQAGPGGGNALEPGLSVSPELHFAHFR